MHIPDGFLDAKTALAAGALAIAGFSYAVRRIKKELSPRHVPLLGLGASFVFAAQMLNFPVAGGTSGHLIGSTLIAVLLGPSAAILVMTAVLVAQCFLFADGGLTALGANVFNMAIIGAAGGYFVYSLLYHIGQAIFEGQLGSKSSQIESKIQVLACAIAAWCSTILASILCAGELAASQTTRWSLVFPTMVGIHALIGIGEAAISAFVLVSIIKTRPDLVPRMHNKASQKIDLAPEKGKNAAREFLIFGGLISVGLVLFASPWASQWPDGLDKTAIDLGFAARAAQSTIASALFPDYKISSLGDQAMSTSLAGLIGTLIVFGVAFLLGRIAMGRHVKESSGKHLKTIETKIF